MGKARFSVAFDDGAGGMGPVLVARGRSGPVVRRRAVYSRRSTPGQIVQEGRMKRVGEAWGRCGEREAQAWAAYALTIEKRNPVNGIVYSPSGYNAFSGLALRIVQIAPLAEIPLLPPVGGFAGDSISVAVEGSGEGSPLSGGSRSGGERLPEPPPPAPSSKTSPLEEGVLRFVASGANAPGVVTEIMVEKLANVRRKPSGGYKSRGFFAFEKESLTFGLPVEAGTYACAIRFVERAGGRATAVEALGTVTVGA